MPACEEDSLPQACCAHLAPCRHCSSLCSQPIVPIGAIPVQHSSICDPVRARNYSQALAPIPLLLLCVHLFLSVPSCLPEFLIYFDNQWTQFFWSTEKYIFIYIYIFYYYSLLQPPFLLKPLYCGGSSHMALWENYPWIRRCRERFPSALPCLTSAPSIESLLWDLLLLFFLILKSVFRFLLYFFLIFLSYFVMC